jgi:hypothetical protein
MCASTIFFFGVDGIHIFLLGIYDIIQLRGEQIDGEFYGCQLKYSFYPGVPNLSHFLIDLNQVCNFAKKTTQFVMFFSIT